MYRYSVVLFSLLQKEDAFLSVCMFLSGRRNASKRARSDFTTLLPSEFVVLSLAGEGKKARSAFLGRVEHSIAGPYRLIKSRNKDYDSCAVELRDEFLPSINRWFRFGSILNIELSPSLAARNSVLVECFPGRYEARGERRLATKQMQSNFCSNWKSWTAHVESEESGQRGWKRSNFELCRLQLWKLKIIAQKSWTSFLDSIGSSCSRIILFRTEETLDTHDSACNKRKREREGPTTQTEEK